MLSPLRSLLPAIHLLSIPPAPSRLLLALVLSVSPAFGDSPAADAEEVIELPAVIITGSRLERAPTLPTAALHVFEPAELTEAFAFTSPADLINALPFTHGSGSSTSRPWNDNNAQQSADFRGLGDAHHIILLNGRRAALFPQVNGSTIAPDLGNLPASGLATVVVLPQSASAVYGSDAAAGVIDLRLPRRFDGSWLRARVGNGFNNDVRHLSLEAVTGGRLGRGHWVIGAELRQQRGLVAANTRRGYTEDRRPWGGADLRQSFGWPGQVVLPAGAAVPANLLGGPITVGTVLGDGTVQHGAPTTTPRVQDFVALPPPFTNGQPTPGDTTNLFDRAIYYALMPDERSRGAWLMAEWPLSAAAGAPTLFFEGVVRRQQLRSTLHPFRVNLSAEDRRGDGPGGTLVLPATNPYNPFGVDLFDVRFSMVEMGPRIRRTTNDSLRFVTGLRGGEKDGLTWEIAAGHHRQRALEIGENFTSDVLLQDALAGRLGGWLNPFGPSDAGVIDAMRVPVRVDAVADLAFADANIAGDLGERIAWLVGVETRAEELRRLPDDLLAVGGHASWSPQIALDFDREVHAAFGELSYRPLDGLRTWLSLRHDNYSDFGGATRPRLGVEWEPIPGWFLAATWGDSFKAPELVQLNADQIAFTGIIVDPLRPELGPYEFLYRAGGNPDLLPESTESSRFSLTWQPPKRAASIGIAYWRFHQRDAVTSIGPLLIMQRAIDGDLASQQRIQRAPNEPDGRPGRVLAIDDSLGNFAGIFTDGVDFFAHGTLGRWSGIEWKARAEVTWLHAYRYLPADGPPIGYGGRTYRPRWTGLGYLTGDRGPWSGAAAFRFIGPMRDPSVNYLGRSSDLPAYVTLDLGLGRQFPSRNLTIRLQITNALDLRPPVETNNTQGTPATLYPLTGRGFLLTIDHRFGGGRGR